MTTQVARVAAAMGDDDSGERPRETAASASSSINMDSGITPGCLGSAFRSIRRRTARHRLLLFE